MGPLLASARSATALRSRPSVSESASVLAVSLASRRAKPGSGGECLGHTALAHGRRNARRRGRNRSRGRSDRQLWATRGRRLDGAELRRRLRRRLRARHLRVRPDVVRPPAVLVQPGPAVPLRRLRAVSAAVPADPAAARADRPLADGRRAGADRRASRSSSGCSTACTDERKETDVLHTSRDPSRQAQARALRLPPRARSTACSRRSPRASRPSGASGPTTPTASSCSRAS